MKPCITIPSLPLFKSLQDTISNNHTFESSQMPTARFSLRRAIKTLEISRTYRKIFQILLSANKCTVIFFMSSAALRSDNTYSYRSSLRDNLVQFFRYLRWFSNFRLLCGCNLLYLTEILAIKEIPKLCRLFCGKWTRVFAPITDKSTK